MKQEKGITTTTVIIYIITMLFAIAILSVLSNYFFKVINKQTIATEKSVKYTKFMSYFVQDIQEKGNSVKTVKTVTENNAEVNYIEFSNGNIYKYNTISKILYKNNKNICDNIDYCKFYLLEYQNKKFMIKINFIAGEFNKSGENALVFYM